MFTEYQMLYKWLMVKLLLSDYYLGIIYKLLQIIDNI